MKLAAREKERWEESVSERERWRDSFELSEVVNFGRQPLHYQECIWLESGREYREEECDSLRRLPEPITRNQKGRSDDQRPLLSSTARSV